MSNDVKGIQKQMIDLRRSIHKINAWPAIRDGWLNLLTYTAFCSLFMTIIILGTKNSAAASGSLFAISNGIKDIIIDEYSTFLTNVYTLQRIANDLQLMSLNLTGKWTGRLVGVSQPTMVRKHISGKLVQR